MKKLIYILLLLPSFVVSQDRLDSLLMLWKNNETTDHDKVAALNAIIWEYYLFSQPDSAEYFAKEHYAIAIEMEDLGLIAESENVLGISFALRSEYDSAYYYFYRYLGTEREMKNNIGISNALNNIGNLAKDQGDYQKAIQYYHESIAVCEEIGAHHDVATTLNNIGTIYQEQGENEKALTYYQESLELQQQNEDQEGIANALSNIAIIYQYLGDYEKALNYTLKSLAIEEEIGNLYGKVYSYNNLATLYLERGEFDKGVDYAMKAVDIAEEISDDQGKAMSLTALGNLYYNKGEYPKAIELGKLALASAEVTNGIKWFRDANYLLSNAYKKMNDSKNALEAYEKYILYRDSIQSEDNHKEIIRQEYKYQYEKQAAADSVKAMEASKLQEAEIARQEAEIEAREKEQIVLYGGLGLVVLFSLFIFNRFRITSKQKTIIEEQKSEVEKQKELADQQKELAEQQREIVEEKNQEIMDSINYAKRIQSAILPPNKLVKEYLKNSFILYKPKDVVAGDFYWMENKDSKVLFAACDCTGHGVPGAMVSVVCVNGLNRSVREHGLTDPGKILDKTREIVVKEFEKSEEEVKDGMDVALCSLDGNKLEYAGAHNPLWIIRKGSEEVEEIKATKEPIGKFDHPNPYTTHTVDLNEGDSVYIFSDGYADQFGGEKGKKFKTANFKRLLLSIQHESMEKQQVLIDEAFENWRGEIEQIDDVCVIGVRI